MFLSLPVRTVLLRAFVVSASFRSLTVLPGCIVIITCSLVVGGLWYGGYLRHDSSIICTKRARRGRGTKRGLRRLSLSKISKILARKRGGELLVIVPKITMREPIFFTLGLSWMAWSSCGLVAVSLPLLPLQRLVVLLEAWDNAEIGLALRAVVLGLAPEDPAVGVGRVPAVVAAEGRALSGLGAVPELVRGLVVH